jgi:hypothetical protein
VAGIAITAGGFLVPTDGGPLPPKLFLTNSRKITTFVAETHAEDFSGSRQSMGQNQQKAFTYAPS